MRSPACARSPVPTSGVKCTILGHHFNECKVVLHPSSTQRKSSRKYSCTPLQAISLPQHQVLICLTIAQSCPLLDLMESKRTNVCGQLLAVRAILSHVCHYPAFSGSAFPEGRTGPPHRSVPSGGVQPSAVSTHPNTPSDPRTDVCVIYFPFIELLIRGCTEPSPMNVSTRGNFCLALRSST